VIVLVDFGMDDDGMVEFRLAHENGETLRDTLSGGAASSQDIIAPAAAAPSSAFRETSRIACMSFYAKYVLPHVIDLAMRNPETRRLRETWIPQARGEVLEVGIGSGLNLEFYSSQVERIYGVDPSIELQRMARKRTGSVKVEFLSQSAEEPLPLANASIDTIVLTWTLCSIPNPPKALKEMKRVLKADGRLIFVEHGRATDSGVAAWQDRLTPMWKHIGGGCHLNRRIDELIRGAGFQIPDLRTGYLPGPRSLTYTYQGVARPIPLD
jgi:SAM-dependent methyltransferase